MTCARSDHVARDLQHMILDTLSCVDQENASQVYHIRKEAEHGDSGRAYLSLLAQQVTTLMSDVTTLQPVFAGSGAQLAELMVRLVTNDRRIKRIVEASEVSGSIVRSLCQSRTISCSSVLGVVPVRKRFWFCFVQVSTTQFCSFPAFPWPVRATANVPIF